MNRDTFQPSPLAEVDCRAADDGWTLVFVRELSHPPETVWAALTDPAQLSRWAPYTADRDLDAPGAATLTMVDGGTSEDLPAEVVRADRPTLLEHTWGSDRLRWELTPTQAGTRLALHHTLQDQEFVPKAAAGWHLCLDVAGHLLDGTPIDPIRGAEAVGYGWNELNAAYCDEFGIPNTGMPDHLT